MAELFAGLMSGTSLDGVDGVLASFPGDAAAGDTVASAMATNDGATRHGSLAIRAHAYRSFPDALRRELLSLNACGPDELHRSALAANELAHLYAQVVDELLAQAGVARTDVRAIGSHGQTVRHRPELGYSWQINSPALLAELSGIGVVADFRSRDIAAGGQGAPLVPAFHRALFGRAGETLAVLNLGGISNLTSLRADGGVRGFDCGPANVLMDHWCLQQRGTRFDADGAWAASGRVDDRLLAALLDEPYFSQPPPKSTGRDLFNAHWLASRMQRLGAHVEPENVQATLCELTALTCAAAVQHHSAGAAELLVCGGGALNLHLMDRLARHLPGVSVAPTDVRGLPAQHVEAAAFAWLACRHVHGRSGNIPAVTGAASPRILGAFHPA